MSTFEKVKESIVNSLQCDEDIVTMEASVTEDLGADSLDIMDLIIELEDSFGVKIEDSRAKTIKTVGDIVAVIDELAG
ncbi:MAG: acyl carrier protein [Defluviitaleaceae bacterium]|nr:acyl carrier protein [Defluviitaleaceae bacterium]